tara:strand:+ start:4249 stop:5010 length:762 start_codon:yes stop_codon:yes gene_type:complete
VVKFTGDNKTLTKFLEGFGKDLQDIALRISEEQIEAAVGKETHYLRRQIGIRGGEEGVISISDLPKVVAFLKATKAGEVTFQQMGKSSTLHISCGNSKLQVPTSSYLQSQSDVSLIEKLIRKSEKNMWQSWASFPLDYHAQAKGEDFYPAAQFSKVISGKFSCKSEFDPDGEFVIRAGSKVKGKMFVRVPLTNVESPPNSANSGFAYWLPVLLSNLPSGDVTIHTGDDTVLVIEQPETGFLLVVMDQDYDEED